MTIDFDFVEQYPPYTEPGNNRDQWLASERAECERQLIEFRTYGGDWFLYRLGGCWVAIKLLHFSERPTRRIVRKLADPKSDWFGAACAEIENMNRGGKRG